MTTKAAQSAHALTDEQFHAIARALADPRRFTIFEQISAGQAMTCSYVREQHDVTPATVSHHLKELSDAGLIVIEREGRTANLKPVKPLWRAYLKRLAAI